MKYLPQTLLSLLLSQAFAQSEMKLDNEQGQTVSIASTSTEVCQKTLLGSITTRVDLDIGKLTLVEGCFQGTYSVDVDTSTVPALFRFVAEGKSESGQITLPFNQSIDEFEATGGILRGRGYCAKKNKSRIITCEVIPGDPGNHTGTIKLTIDTGNRIMDFVSQYTVNQG